MAQDNAARGLASKALRNAASAMALAMALGAGTAEATLAITQNFEDYSATRLIGVPVPVTATAAANSVFVYSIPFEEDGEIIEFGYFNINGSGPDQVKLKILEDAGADWTLVSETAHDSVQDTLKVNTIGDGFDAPVPVQAGQFWGTYSHFGSARIGQVSNGAPAIAYWESTGGDHVGTFAKGSFVTNKTTQCYIVVRYASGRLARMVDSLESDRVFPLIFGKGSQETVGDGAAEMTASSTTIRWDPTPIPKAGIPLTLEIGANTPGGVLPAPLIMVLGIVGANQNDVDVYSQMTIMANHGTTTVDVSSLEFPEQHRCFIGYVCQTNGAKMRTTAAGGATVPSPGYGLKSTISGALLGPNTFTSDDVDIRFDHRLTMKAVRPKVANTIITECQFGGSVRPWHVCGVAADSTFTATGVAFPPSKFGLGKGIRGHVEEAFNKSRTHHIMTLGAYDAPIAGKRLTIGLYGTGIIPDVATNTLSIQSVAQNTLGTSGAGTQLASKSAPFATPLVAGDVLHIITEADDRKFSVWVIRANGERAQFVAADIVPNAASGAKSATAIAADTVANRSTLTFDINAWFDESDLKRMGMLKGAWFWANNRATRTTWTTSTAYAVGNMVEQGGNTYYCITAHTAGTFSTDLASGKWGLWTSSELNYILHDSECLAYELEMVVDSMGDSRWPFNTTWFGRMRSRAAAAGKRFCLNSVHGANSTGHRITSCRAADYMDHLQGVYWAGGMNDVIPSNPVATAGAQADMVLYQAYDRNIAVAVCDVFLTYIVPDPDLNDGNKEFTTYLRASAIDIGAPSITFQTTASINRAGLLRNESWANGPLDAHLGSDGHKWADEQSGWQCPPEFGLTPTPPKSRPYMLPFAWSGTQAASEVLERWQITDCLILDKDRVSAIARVAATSTTTITFKLDGTTIMTVVFAGGATVGTVTVSTIRWGPGVLEITSSGDATLADVSVTTSGDR